MPRAQSLVDKLVVTTTCNQSPTAKNNLLHSVTHHQFFQVVGSSIDHTVNKSRFLSSIFGMKMDTHTLFLVIHMYVLSPKEKKKTTTKKRKEKVNSCAAEKAICTGLLGQCLHPQLGTQGLWRFHNETSIDFGFSIRNAG